MLDVSTPDVKYPVLFACLFVRVTISRIGPYPGSEKPDFTTQRTQKYSNILIQLMTMSAIWRQSPKIDKYINNRNRHQLKKHGGHHNKSILLLKRKLQNWVLSDSNERVKYNWELRREESIEMPTRLSLWRVGYTTPVAVSATPRWHLIVLSPQ